MKCPVCKNLMIVVEHEKIELDYCVNCAGVWFDSGELELFLETMNLEKNSLSPGTLLSSPEAKTAEKKRKCPICAKKMRKAAIGEEPKVLLDACTKGDGLWFDGGEVEQLIKQLAGKSPQAASSQERIVNFMGKTFMFIK
jgi:Zn-finger nucleic acid-binding protein